MHRAAGTLGCRFPMGIQSPAQAADPWRTAKAELWAIPCADKGNWYSGHDLSRDRDLGRDRELQMIKPNLEETKANMAETRVWCV